MDDLDDILAPRPLPAEPPGLRDAAWAPAAAVQRRRRWLGAAQTVAVLAACYLAGVATMAVIQNRERRRPLPEAPVADAPGSDKQDKAPEPPADPYRNDTPPTLERWAARSTGEKRAELYRRAGD